MIINMNKTPESKGISSLSLLRFVKKLDERKIPMHSLLIARGDDIILNAYWSPFDDKTLHRQNSVTKSFVALAIGLLEEEGKLRLSDKIIDYFPEAETYEVPDKIKNQTVYDLLTMRTTLNRGKGGHWVKDKKYDRIKAYFSEYDEKVTGSFFNYDSRGAYMLGVIVERLTGKPFMEYLKEKLLTEIGFSENASCIMDPNGYSWSDSGLLCTAEDLYRVAKFIKQGGVWEGKRLMNEKFLRDATSCITATCVEGNDGDYDANGYGYLIWHEIMDGFGFNGMGMQYMFCIPKLDFYIVCNADTQKYPTAQAIFRSMFEDLVNEEIYDNPLPEKPEAYEALLKYCRELKLVSLSGMQKTEFTSCINGKTFDLGPTRTGIKWFRLNFDGDHGTFVYENYQGEKLLPFGICKNVFTDFPEDGYDNMIIGESPAGYRHPCAVSAAWQDDRTFAIKVQVIGNHLGGIYIRMGFNGNQVSVDIRKTTNCFLNEYDGTVIGEMRN